MMFIELIREGKMSNEGDKYEGFPGVEVEQHQGDYIRRIVLPNSRLVSDAARATPVVGNEGDKLLPCPFCGYETPTNEPANDDHGTPSVYCYNCSASVLAGSDKKAILKWNTRATPVVSNDGDREAFYKAKERLYTASEGAGAVARFWHEQGIEQGWYAARATPVVNRDDVRDEMREAFEKIMLQTGIEVGPFMPNVGHGCYAWSQVNLDYVRMRKMWQAATASAEARYKQVIEKLAGALEKLRDDIWDDAVCDGALAEAAPLLRGRK